MSDAYFSSRAIAVCYVGDGEVMNPEQVIPPSAGMPRPMLNSAAIQWQFYATFTTTETRAPSRTGRVDQGRC